MDEHCLSVGVLHCKISIMMASKALNVQHLRCSGASGAPPSFGSVPDSILPGGRAMARPLGGGEYVQNNKGPANRIEPHTMPRPHGSAAEAPVVSHLGPGSGFTVLIHPWTAQYSEKCICFVDQFPCNFQVFYTRLNANEHSVPPPASSRYIVKDTGDCSPRFMRATLNNVPATADLCRMGAMPLAVIVSPLALPDPQDDPIQVPLYLARHSC